MTYSYAKKGKRTTRSTVKRFNVMVKPALLEELDQFCIDNNYKRNHLMDVMLTEFLDKWGTPETKVNKDEG
jgi:metal-responsive CopG/Arc/MetJ family transcriptional regulator